MFNYMLSTLLLVGVSLALVAPQPLASSYGKVSVEQHGRAGPGYLHLPVHRNDTLTRNAANRKRQDVGLPLENVISSYSITLSIGTPPQTVEVLFDTGSSELWVNPSCATSVDPYSCDLNGLYNASASFTSVNLGTAFSITYGSGSVSGTYVTDTINVGGAILRADQFGSGTTSSGMLSGVFGAGLGNGFLTMNYNSVIDNLRADGIIQSRAFSLDLASIDVANGSVIFGAIDTTKYSGSLQKMSIIPYTSAPQRYPRYWINLSAVAVTPPGANTSTALYNTLITVVPDSGSTWSYLPAALFNAILAQFPSATSVGGGQYTVPCSVRSLTGSLQFLFGTTWINVSYHEFIWFNGEFCYIAALSAGMPYVLGDSFMRSAYFVYDQDNFNVHVAQAAACTAAVSNIIPISTGVNAVPSIIGGCNPGSTVIISTSTSAPVSTLTSVKITSSSLVVSTKATSTSTSTSQVRSTTVVSSSHITSTSQVKSTSVLSSSKITSSSLVASRKAMSTSTSQIRSTTALSSSKITSTSQVGGVGVLSSSKITSTSTSQVGGVGVLSSSKITSTSHVGTSSVVSSSKIASTSQVVSSLGVSSSPKSTIVSTPTSHNVNSMTVSSSQLVSSSILSSPSRTITSTTQLVRSTTASTSQVVTSSSTIASTFQPGSSLTAFSPSSSTITSTTHGIISSSAPSSQLSTSTSAPQAAAISSTVASSASPSSSSQVASSPTSSLGSSSSSTFAQAAATSPGLLVLSSSSNSRTSSSTLQAAASSVASSFPSSSVSSSLSSSTTLSTSTVVYTSIVYATSIVISTSTIVSTSTFIQISSSPATPASSFLTAVQNPSALPSSMTLSSSNSPECTASVSYTVTVTSVSLKYTGAHGTCTAIGQSF